jgi:hypothetical protein
MGSSRRRQLRRERQQVERRRSRREGEARKAQEQQEAAAARQDLSRRRRRHAVAYMLFILGAVMAVYHVFEHIDVVPPMTTSSALDDVLVGWPMAGVLAVTGGIVYGT